MTADGFFQRLSDSLDYVLLGADLFISILVAVLFSIYRRDATGFDVIALINGGVSLTTTMVAVILTGISILVTMSDKRTLVILRKNNNEYRRFLFTFEFTALLALSTAVLGIVLQTIGPDPALVIFFVFLLAYSITAIATVISRLITYGQKVATIAALEDLPDDLSDLVKKEGEEEEGNPNKESEKET